MRSSSYLCWHCRSIRSRSVRPEYTLELTAWLPAAERRLHVASPPLTEHMLVASPKQTSSSLNPPGGAGVWLRLVDSSAIRWLRREAAAIDWLDGRCPSMDAQCVDNGGWWVLQMHRNGTRDGREMDLPLLWIVWRYTWHYRWNGATVHLKKSSLERLRGTRERGDGGCTYRGSVVMVLFEEGYTSPGAHWKWPEAH